MRDELVQGLLQTLNTCPRFPEKSRFLRAVLSRNMTEIRGVRHVIDDALMTATTASTPIPCETEVLRQALIRERQEFIVCLQRIQSMVEELLSADDTDEAITSVA